ncbi:hypothetical protein J4450_05640 [Candidatus Micrarchaeota archaeon]|nr:hypothetical protein [Candidatus Micrarchaeota archaeon]
MSIKIPFYPNKSVSSFDVISSILVGLIFCLLGGMMLYGFILNEAVGGSGFPPPSFTDNPIVQIANRLMGVLTILVGLYVLYYGVGSFYLKNKK